MQKKKKKSKKEDASFQLQSPIKLKTWAREVLIFY